MVDYTIGNTAEGKKNNSVVHCWKYTAGDSAGALFVTP